jgi:branched-chain amino acid transport system substrate-binding protein
MRKANHRGIIYLPMLVTLAALTTFLMLGAAHPSKMFAAAENEVVIAAIIPFTGPNASWGIRNDRGMRIMIDKINAMGGIKSLGGAKFKYITADTESKPEIAQSQAEKIVGQKVSAILGCNQSPATITVTQVTERKKIPLICVSDFDPLITSRGFKYIFRTTPIMRDIAKMLLIYAQAMNKAQNTNHTKVGILCEDSIVGDSAAKSLAKKTKEIGYDLIDVVKYNAATTRDFTGVLSRYKARGVELVVGHNKPADSIQIVRNLKEINFNPIMIGGISGGWVAPEFPVNLGALTEGIIVSTVETPDIGVGKFGDVKEEYEKEFNEEIPSNVVGGISGIWLLYKALEAAGSKDPKVIAKTLRDTQLEYGEGYYFQQFGVKFDENGDNVRAGATVSQFRGGTRLTVFPKDVATTESIWPKPNFQ